MSLDGELGKRVDKEKRKKPIHDSLNEIREKSENQIKRYLSQMSEYKQAMNNLMDDEKIVKEELIEKSINIEDPNLNPASIFHVKAKRRPKKSLPQYEPKINGKEIGFSSELMEGSNQQESEIVGNEEKFIQSLFDNKKGEHSNNELTPRNFLYDLPSLSKEALYSQIDFDDFLYVPKEEMSQRSDLLEASAPLEHQAQSLYNTKAP